MPSTPPSAKSESASKPITIPKKADPKVKIIDRVASYVIRGGGSLIIIAVAAIFLFIGKEALPLFLPANANLSSNPSPPQFATNSLSVFGIDEYDTFSYWLNPNGTVELNALDGSTNNLSLKIDELREHPVTSAYRSPERHHMYLGTEDGHVILSQVKFRPTYSAETGRTIIPSLSEPIVIEVSAAGNPIVKVFGRHDSDGVARFAALDSEGKLFFGSAEEDEEAEIDYVEGLSGDAVTAIAIDADASTLFAATDAGTLLYWYLDMDIQKPFATVDVGNSSRSVSTMELLIGGTSVILGFSDGSIEQWFAVREKAEDSVKPFRHIRSLEPLPSAVTTIEPSGRNKGFFAGAEDGALNLYFTTSERTIVRLKAEAPIAAVAYAPKLTSVLALTTNGEASLWDIDNPHPEISWKTLFGKVWYENYDEPEYIWQSTGGSNEFEAKLSLIPLGVGTLKGAFYGLLFAIPLAVLGALYASQFMTNRVKSVVKPAVEIMAALPSVVIGFMAGLWLAPILERHLLSLGAMLILIPTFLFISVVAWHKVPISIRVRLPMGLELGIISVLVIIGYYVSAELGPLMEVWWFGGDLRQWLFETTGSPMEQRNSIVIGFAMGFAVIPIIFTISEDALSNVPKHFTSGSLALGASRWQTAARIILPTASPGIFSATMVGFGRAVGETMIVLMATGNTPILDFSPFNGMRTMSANIAVEIPEAPVAGTLYRVLFLTAILLFLLTFVVNTVAEVIRHRLRNKYQAV